MKHRSHNKQSGAILVIVLVFLGVVTLLSVSSMHGSTTGIHMAQNEEARFIGVQEAQALTEAVVSDPGTTPVIGGAGFSICTAGEPGCDRYGIPLPPYLTNEVAVGRLSARIERLTPPNKPPPRVVESSIDKFSTASFQVSATYDRTQEGLGRVELAEGIIVLVPNF
ncbi:MAG TPA: hypothetical protein VIV14_06085 [Gammaproteobacteria bacterium]